MKVNLELFSSIKELPSGKKVYFASDFHLGAPNEIDSLKREKKIIEWLEYVSKDASAIFLLGDIFDFWFEYKTTIPKGFIRFQGKLAELKDRGIQIFIFAGNHDLWYKDYFPSQLNIPVIKKTASIQLGVKKLFLAHGDGIGEGAIFYKIIKLIFSNPICNWLFRWVHPDIGVSLAKFWSNTSRKSHEKEDSFMGDQERLLKFCQKVNERDSHDYYVFGHRHLPMELRVDDTSTYFNLGEWISQCNYLEFDGEQAILKHFTN